MIACPACKRRVFTPGHMLRVSLDGRVRCPVCHELARLDQMSRLLITGLLALLLWLLLLHANILYSGYLFIFSTVAIIGGWRLLSAAALPLLSLEKAPGSTCFDRRQNLVTLTALLLTAIVIDSLLSYRSEADRRHATAVSSSDGVRSR